MHTPDSVMCELCEDVDQLSFENVDPAYTELIAEDCDDDDDEFIDG